MPPAITKKQMFLYGVMENIRPDLMSDFSSKTLNPNFYRKLDKKTNTLLISKKLSSENIMKLL